MSKSELRKLAKNYRNGFSEAVWQRIGNRIESRFCEWFAGFGDIQRVAIYLTSTTSREIPTSGIIDFLIDKQVEVAVPRVLDESGHMDMVLYRRSDKLISNKWGIPEPSASEVVSSEWPQLVVVPMLSGSVSGYRIGYGKGYYDRFLENKPLIKAGLCPDDLIFHEIPTDPHDIKLDYILTESEVIRTR